MYKIKIKSKENVVILYDWLKDYIGSSFNDYNVPAFEKDIIEDFKSSNDDWLELINFDGIFIYVKDASKASLTKLTWG